MEKIKILFTSIRLIQWSKNLLIFVPLIISGVINFELFHYSLIGFISFSLMSSAGYLVNDIIDKETDRKHPLKSKRPIAALDIPIKIWIALIVILVILSDLLAYFYINNIFLITVNVYFLLSLIYTLIIKKISFVDLIFLSSLYTIRLIAGCIVIDMLISNWLFIFSIFFFLSLATNKRIIELKFFKKNNSYSSKYKSYSTNSINILDYISLSSIVLSLVTLSAYFMSDETAAIFSDNIYIVNISYVIIVTLILARFNILSKIDKNSDNQIEIYIKDLISMIFCSILLIMILFENAHANILFI